MCALPIYIGVVKRCDKAVIDRQARLLAVILVVEQSRVDRQPPVEEAVFRAKFEGVEHFLTDRPQRRDISGQRTEGAEAVVEADAFDTARKARIIGLVA